MDIASPVRLADRPPHVPESVVYDFDLFHDEAFLQDPHTRILDLYKQAPPIFWTRSNGGHWMLLSHRANFEAARDTETFSSELIPHALIKQMMASMPAGSPRIPLPFPITLDPPEHRVYRLPLQAPFSPKAIGALEAKIRGLAIELIEKIRPAGAAEFMAAVAEPLPVQVFLEMFGLPVARQIEYRELVKQQMASLAHTPEGTQGRLLRVAEIMRDTLLDRRDHPRDDLISLLWQSKVGDRATTLEDLEDYSVLLFIAGLDTVMNGIGHGVIHLARNPDVQRRLRESPTLISRAMDEILRRYTFTVPPRRVAKDTVFMGVEMKAHDRAMLFLPGADLDPAVYVHPERYDLNRETYGHIAFGAGPHRCLGSHLARLELQILYEELLKRLPEFHLDSSKSLRYHGGHVIGPDAVWLRWNA